jgi:hypothetical protein
VATIWLDEVATATDGGIPKNIRMGVIKNPPPIPKSPDNIPPSNPKTRIKYTFTGNSAMGR